MPELWNTSIEVLIAKMDARDKLTQKQKIYGWQIEGLEYDSLECVSGDEAKTVKLSESSIIGCQYGGKIYPADEILEKGRKHDKTEFSCGDVNSTNDEKTEEYSSDGEDPDLTPNDCTWYKIRCDPMLEILNLKY
jgi:hypothetical protein